MAALFTTSDPTGLLNAFKVAIDSKTVKTWRYDNDGDFSHTESQFQDKAWFRPKVEAGKLSFYIIKAKTQNITPFVYAYYHGHIIETFLYHFDKSFSLSTATAMPVPGDIVQ